MMNQQRKPNYVLSQSQSNQTTRNPSRSKDNMATNKLVNTFSRENTAISLAVNDRREHDEAQAQVLSEQILSYCRQNKIHFVDDQFPPTDLSLGDIEPIHRHILQWLPVCEIIPSSSRDLLLKWTVCSSPQPSDISQGALGDCWLMAALALITERPEMLDHIVLTKKVNKEGVYSIRLCHNGLWKTIIVDDCFPCTEYRQLAFTQANHRQLYVPLIEKACAKLFGSYGDLISGKTEEGLQLLTGAPCDRIDLHGTDEPVDGDIVWAKLLSACESGLLIGASTGRPDISAEEYARQRIHGNHAFSVLAADCLSSIGMQFVLVRDPHARSNYVDELLSSSSIARLNSKHPNGQSSGAFWISWPKFLRFFSSITVSTYSSDFYDVREVARFTRSSTQLIPTFHFHIPKTSLINISLLYHRENRRVHSTHTQSFVLCNVDQVGQKEVGTTEAILCTDRGSFTHWIGSLRPGFYVLIPFSTSFWSENTRRPRDYTLVIHANRSIDLQMIQEPPTLLSDCLIAAVMKDPVLLTQKRDYKLAVTSSKHKLTLFIAENSSTTNYLNVVVDLADSVRVRHSRQSMVTYDSIPPRHRQIIFLAEWMNDAGEQAKIEYSYQVTQSRSMSGIMPEIFMAQNCFHAHRPF